MTRDFIKATSLLVGTIIGAGIFGVPYVMAQSGFWAGTVLFTVLTAIMVIMHLMYAEVVERTGDGHRLTGYMNIYFGKRFKGLTSFFDFTAVYGSIIVYILIANEFLSSLFGDILSYKFSWGIIFWALMSFGIIKGIKTISKMEIVLLALLGTTLLAITIRGFPMVEFSNLDSFNFKNIFAPYGVILFALAGFQAIPEIRSVISSDGKTFRNAIITGVLFSALATFVFAFVVVGVSGETTSPEAISGLKQFLGSEIVYLGAVLGLIAVTTTYLVVGVNMKESFMYDWNISKWKSDLLLVLPPILLISLGVTNFIDVIGVVGAVLGAASGLMITFLFVACKKKGRMEPSFNMRLPNPVLMVVIFALVLGGFYEIIKIILG